MIVLRKLNEEKFLINHQQIECIEMIPETKIVMMNHDFFLVLESIDEILTKIIEYHEKVHDFKREIIHNQKQVEN